MNDFNLRAYLKHNPLLKEDFPFDSEFSGGEVLLDFIMQNADEVANAIGTDSIIDISIDDIGDVGATDEEGFGGYAFRLPFDVDDDFDILYLSSSSINDL